MYVFESWLIHLTNYLPKVKEPEKYPTDVKPAELNLYAVPPRMKTAPGPAQNTMMGGFGLGPMNCYPPYRMPPWYLPPPPPTHTTPPPAAPKGTSNSNVEFPKIPEWLRYCDRHPQRKGENLGQHIGSFEKEGFRRINQLAGSRISVEKLSEWLNIGKGTADLIIQFAEEDVELAKAGGLRMELWDMPETHFQEYE
jgi:hypothetical protein